jgi:flagellar assembly factor FliW
MKIRTTRFGVVDVGDNAVISLPDGILGFPSTRHFVLLEHDSEGTPFKWLQAVDDPSLAFIVIDPNLMISDYDAPLDADCLELFGPDLASEQIVMMSIVNVPREQPIAMTVNVRAPIAVHLEKRLGRQIVLPNEGYQIRHRIFPDAPEGTSKVPHDFSEK